MSEKIQHKTQTEIPQNIIPQQKTQNEFDLDLFIPNKTQGFDIFEYLNKSVLSQAKLDIQNSKEARIQAEALIASTLLIAWKQMNIFSSPTDSSPKLLINELLNQIQVFKNENQTDLLVTLQSPKILEGAIIHISSIGLTKGEVNITISNLSAEAKELFDRNKRQLIERVLLVTGLIVQEITTELNHLFRKSQSQKRKKRRKKSEREDR